MEAYQWYVALQQGDLLIPEYDEMFPQGRGFSDITAPIKSVMLIGEGGSHCCLIPQGANPVFFRRRALTLVPGMKTQHIATAHCIGYEGEMGSSYLFVFEDNSTLLTHDRNAI